MFIFGRKKVKSNNELFSVATGRSVDLSTVNDDVFSKKILGDGIAVIPYSDYIVSPCEGTVIMIAETRHAIAIENPQGIQILIHIGLDTVNLKGNGFETYVKVGDKVEKGKVLVEFNKDLLKKENISDIIMMIITNSNGHKILEYNKDAEVQEGKSILIKCE